MGTKNNNDLFYICLLYTSNEKVSGWYTDHCIGTIEIGALQKGTNIVEATVPFTHRIGLESVSYTHLDVYKRQAKQTSGFSPGCSSLR